MAAAGCLWMALTQQAPQPLLTVEKLADDPDERVRWIAKHAFEPESDD